MTPDEWVEKHATLEEGANFDEFKALVNDLNPLKNLTTNESQVEFMERNFKGGLERFKEQAIRKHDEKFMAEKLPGLLSEEKDKWMKEQNPEETPQDKELRELKEWKAAQEKKEVVNQLKGELRAKAKDLGYDGDAERYSVYGEKALEMMESDYKANQEYIEREVAKLSKERFGNNPPPNRSDQGPPKDVDAQITEARKSGNSALALKLQMQKLQMPNTN